MLINVSNTPNHNVLKFIVPKTWINFVWECQDEEQAEKSPLAKKIFAIEGVTYMLFGKDFVSVAKAEEASWQNLESVVLETISDFLNQNISLFATELKQNEEAKINYNELDLKMIKVIEEKVQPAVEHHGGVVKFHSFQDGILKLEMLGACKGCSSSEITLKNGIQNLMQYYFPEIASIESVE